MVYRILFSMFKFGLFDRNNTGRIDADVRSQEHS